MLCRKQIEGQERGFVWFRGREIHLPLRLSFSIEEEKVDKHCAKNTEILGYTRGYY